MTFTQRATAEHSAKRCEGIVEEPAVQNNATCISYKVSGKRHIILVIAS